MTTRPHLKLGRHLLPGIIAIALFCVFAATFLSTQFGAPEGFPGGGSVMASIGYALFGLTGGAYPSEGFLVAFEIIDIVIVASLVAAVMLAKVDGRVAGALQTTAENDREGKARADGGRETTHSKNGEDR